MEEVIRFRVIELPSGLIIVDSHQYVKYNYGGLSSSLVVKINCYVDNKYKTGNALFCETAVQPLYYYM